MDLRVHTDKPTNVHDPRAFLIQEVALRGVVRGPKGWTAMVLGPDGRTYFVSAGQVFYDATLTAVDVGGMTVQQQVRDPLAPAARARPAHRAAPRPRLTPLAQAEDVGVRR
jgi:hypothetical protein